MITRSEEVQKVICGKCKHIVGMTNRDHLSIKTGEFFVYFYGGMAVISCRLCHTLNIVVDDEYEKNNAERVYQAEQMLNSVRAIFAKWVHNKQHSDR